MSGLNGSLFPAVFGETSALVWTADRDLRLTSWFGSALESQGLEDGRAPGIPLVEFFQLQDRASPMVAAHVHALRGESITFAFELSDRCYDAFVTPQRDAQGHVFGCLGIAREPSRLDQETKQLCRLFNLSRQMLCTATVDGYFRRLDPALAATLGYSVDDLRARPLIEFVHPADRDTTLKELAKLANGQPTLRFENRYRCKDGSYRWLSWTSIPEDEEGVLYATALDITERKRAEELFRAALESAPDAVVIVDLVGEIILVNSVAESMFGYSRTELLGQPVELLVPPAFRRHHIENRGNYSAGPSVRPMGPSRCVLARRKDGSEIPIEVTLSPVDLDEGRMIFASIRDVSERARMEREIRAREIQLEAAREIQRHLLPRESPVVTGFDIAGGLYAADYAAGDFFDFIPATRNRLGIAVGDVCGKGFAAAILSATTHELLRAAASVHSTAKGIVTHVNRVLAGETQDSVFVTLAFMMLDPDKRRVEYVSAGHPDGFILDRDGRVKHRLPHSAGVLALFDDAPIEEGPSVQLEPGDLLFLVTDGVLEAYSANRADGLFGEARTLDVVRRHLDKPAQEIVTEIREAVLHFSENHRAYDDVTIVVVKCL